MIYKIINNIKNILGYHRISFIKQNNFLNFGKNSIIAKPYKQLTNEKNVFLEEDVTILSGSRIAVYGESNNKVITIGKGCYIGFDFSILADSKSIINIGKKVLIASNVFITNLNHSTNVSRHMDYIDLPLESKNVVIEDNCWIGQNVCILPGVTLGEGSIIGAGSVVTKSTPKFSISVGIPAKTIKQFNFKTNTWEAVK